MYGVLCGLSSASSSGVAYIFMRKIGEQVHSCMKPMYFGIFCAITCLIIQSGIEIYHSFISDGKPYKSQFSLVMPAWELGLLLVTGLCGWLAQEGVSKAINLEKAGRVAIINYLQIVICFLFDTLYLKRKVFWTDIVGTIFIVFFSLLGKF